MKKILVLLCMFPSVVMADPLPESMFETMCGRNVGDIKALENELLKARTPIQQENANIVIYDESATNTMWTFTKPAFKPYPALVCRQVVTQNGQVGIATKIKCGGNKKDCDGLVRSYQQLDSQMKQEREKM